MFLVAAGILALLTGCRESGYSNHTRTQIADLIQADSETAVPVRLTGVVTFHDARARRTYLDDGTGGVQVQFASAPTVPIAGLRITVTGTASRQGAGSVVAASSMVVEGPGNSPEARTISHDGFGKRETENRLTRIEGIIETAANDRYGTLAIELRSGNALIDVRTRDYTGFRSDSSIGARVEITGVVSTVLDVNGRPERRRLWVQHHRSITRLAAAPAPPVLTTAQLNQPQPDGLRATILGRLEESRNGSVLHLVDRDGRVSVRTAPGSALIVGRDVMVTGFVDAKGPVRALRNAIVKEASYEGKRSVEIMRSARAIQALSAAVAATAMPVRMKGVVTYNDVSTYIFFVQDTTGGIFVSCHGGPAPQVSAGDEVEVDGVTSAGDFAPIIRAHRVQRVGRSPLPLPAIVPIEHLMGGGLDSQFAQTDGIVQSVYEESGHAVMRVRTAGKTIEVHLLGATPGDVKPLLDARVRVSGVVGAIFNASRQLFGVRLFVASRDQLTVTEPPVGGGSTIMRVVELLQFVPGRIPGHRVRIRGVVTGVQDSGAILYLHDGTGGLRLRSVDPSDARIGDHVEAIGYANADRSAPALTEAAVRKLGKADAPPVRRMAATDILEDLVSYELVELEATLVDQITATGNQVLMLQSGSIAFQAELQGGAGRPLEVERGDRIRIAGVCRLEGSSVFARETFTVLLRDRADVTVVQRAPWLTDRRALYAFAFAGCAALLAAAWATLLRTKVRSQTKLIRQQLEIEEQLKRAAESASKAKTEFLANMSHEIRTPMNGIVGFARLAQERSSDEQQREYLQTVCDSAEALVCIVNDVLDFSKIEAGQMAFDETVFRLPHLLRQTVNLFTVRAAEKGVRLTCEIDNDVPEHVISDPLRLGQVLTNLLSNALKFTEKGSVSCRASMTALESGIASLKISVRDTGIGIPPERQRAIFEAFTQADNSITRKFGGTGLGLSISSRLVKFAGGTIAVESLPGVGSVFTVQLSLPVASGAVTEANAPENAVWPEGLAVLVAEDNAVNQRLIQKLLTSRGLEVTIRDNGKRAVEAFRPGQFDLVLMDLQMPEMDGYQAALAIRELERAAGCSPAVILALTADVMPGVRERCTAAGMDGYVTKPVRIEEVHAEFQRFRRRASSHELQILSASVLGAA